MSFTKYTNLDYDQIKESIKDYLRANSDFSGFDFDGSNFSVLIDTLAYNAYINAVNANMIVNESFLDSATLRRNVVSLAGNIGYLPRSKRSAEAKVRFVVRTDADTPTLTLKPGLVATGAVDNSNYVFSIPQAITAVVRDGTAIFGTPEEPITLNQGTFLQNSFVVDGSLDQRFIINNPSVDYNTLVVRVKDANEQGEGTIWNRVDNIIQVDERSKVFVISEVEDEKYELIFGDGIFGRAVTTGQVITVTYIVTDGKEGNGPANFAYSGLVLDSIGTAVVPTNTVTITTIDPARNGAAIESVDSVRYYAPKVYGSQYRAVTARDYEAIIKQVYPNTESVSVVGGEELVPPQFGNVLLSIKPVNGTEVSEFDKENILRELKQYTIAGINQRIVDLKILYVELVSSVYYDNNKVGSIESLRSNIIASLNTYSSSIDLNKFGGRFKYSKAQKVIDDTDQAITSNITRVLIRRNLSVAIDIFAQYELCYGNAFYAAAGGGNIKTTGFKIFGLSNVVYLTDTPALKSDGSVDRGQLGIISIIYETTTDAGELSYTTAVPEAGSVDYVTGEIKLTTIKIVETSLSNRVIEVQAIPESNDVIGLKDLYVSFDVSETKINMVRDTITSGEQVSGVGFKVTSSYSNGKLSR